MAKLALAVPAAPAAPAAPLTSEHVAIVTGGKSGIKRAETATNMIESLRISVESAKGWLGSMPSGSSISYDVPGLGSVRFTRTFSKRIRVVSKGGDFAGLEYDL